MAKRIIAGLLSDGRLQLWAVNDSDGSIQTRWKQTTHPDAAWTNWQQMNSGAMNRTFESIGAGNLPDGRLQLFIGDTSGNIWSMWKQTIHPDAAWTNLTNF
jgi:hypothetical protein